MLDFWDCGPSRRLCPAHLQAGATRDWVDRADLGEQAHRGVPRLRPPFAPGAGRP